VKKRNLLVVSCGEEFHVNSNFWILEFLVLQLSQYLLDAVLAE